MRLALLTLLSLCTLIGSPLAWAAAACDRADARCCCGEVERRPGGEPAFSERCGCGCTHAEDAAPARNDDEPRQTPSRTIVAPPVVAEAAALPTPSSDARNGPPAAPLRLARAPPLFALHCARLN